MQTASADGPVLHLWSPCFRMVLYCARRCRIRFGWFCVSAAAEERKKVSSSQIQVWPLSELSLYREQRIFLRNFLVHWWLLVPCIREDNVPHQLIVETGEDTSWDPIDPVSDIGPFPAPAVGVFKMIFLCLLRSPHNNNIK